MQRLAELWRRAAFLLRRGRFDREMSEEMRFHLEMKIEENIEGGMTPEEARYAARRQFGNQTLLQEANREVWSFVMIETLLRDVRYAARVLAKSPVFTAVAVVTLALGIGANAAIFSFVNAVLLRPLPVAEPDRLVYVFSGTKAEPYSVASYPDYLDFRDRNRSFSDLAAYSSITLSLTSGGQADMISGLIVTGNYFDALGVRARAGRTFLPEEDSTPGGHPVAVISHALWQSRFAGAPGDRRQLLLN